jgi:membrane protein DedA with SNARE-associated domain/membrane-associated phospholipid phosphatase
MKWGWLLGALALAAFLVVRRRRLEKWIQVTGWIAFAVAAAIGVGLIPLPNLERLIEDIGQALGKWTYLLVGALAFLETGAFVGLVAPGETTVIVGGVVAGQGEISLFVLIAITWACAVAGDVVSYMLGRRLGRAWLVRHGTRVKITEERLSQVESFFARYGGVTILIGRFIGFVRALAPFIAGASKMPLRRFLPYDVLGAGAWATTFCVLGYVFWRSFDRLTEYVSRGLFAFGTVVVVVVGLVLLVRMRRDERTRAQVREWLARHEDTPVVGRLVHLAGPAWRLIGRPTAGATEVAARFGLGRLTPGRLGLELTTLLALLAVGGFTFFFLGDLVGSDPLPGVDDTAADVARELRAGTLVDIAEVVTELGSLGVVAALAAICAGWAAMSGRRTEAVALIFGLLLSFLTVAVAKDAYGRRSPDEGLLDVLISAYPSGYTAYAVTWVAVATVLVRAGTHWAIRFAAVTVAIVLVAVVGLTRVYLGVHHLTDVMGGAALGVATWSLVGVVALVAGHVRHNERAVR